MGGGKSDAGAAMQERCLGVSFKQETRTRGGC